MIDEVNVAAGKNDERVPADPGSHLFGGDKHLDDLGVTDTRQLRLKAARITDAAIRIVHKAEQSLMSRGRKCYGIGRHPLGDFTGPDPALRHPRQNGEMVTWQERHGARSRCWLTGGPFPLSHLVELVS